MGHSEERKQQVGAHTLATQPLPVDLPAFIRNYKRELQPDLIFRSKVFFFQIKFRFNKKKK